MNICVFLSLSWNSLENVDYLIIIIIIIFILSEWFPSDPEILKLTVFLGFMWLKIFVDLALSFVDDVVLAMTYF